jgi:hypothetical protein
MCGDPYIVANHLKILIPQKWNHSNQEGKSYTEIEQL